MKRYRKRRKAVSESQIFLYRYFFVGKAREIEGLKGTLVSPQEIFLYRYRESVVGGGRGGRCRENVLGGEGEIKPVRIVGGSMFGEI